MGKLSIPTTMSVANLSVGGLCDATLGATFGSSFFYVVDSQESGAS